MLHHVFYDHFLAIVMMAFSTDDRDAVTEKAFSELPKMVGYLG